MYLQVKKVGERFDDSRYVIIGLGITTAMWASKAQFILIRSGGITYEEADIEMNNADTDYDIIHGRGVSV